MKHTQIMGNNNKSKTKYLEKLLVSVIIPCFNHAQYLPEAIESALSQSLPPAEIIVIDDGSTDHTPEVAARYHSQIKYIRQMNKGLSSARNTGIHHAKSDLIAFLDADDLWLPEFISKLIPLINQPEIGAAYCGSQFIDPSGQRLPQKQTLAPHPSDFQRQLFNGNFFPVHAVIVRRACVEEVGLFDETLTALEDYDMWLRISERYIFVGMSDVYALTRVCPNSMSADVDRMASQEQTIIHKYFPQGLEQNSFQQADWTCLHGNAELRVATAALGRGQYEKAVDHLTQAFTIYPGLITWLDTYYELLMAGLTRGKKISGELNNLNQAESQAALLLTELFSKKTNKFSKYYSASMASLFVASGQIAYERREMTLARRYFLQSLKTNRQVFLASHSLSFLLKSCLTPITLNWIQNFKLQRNINR